MKEMIIELITGKREPSDIWHYILGNYRHKLYYSRDKIGAVRAYGSKHPLMRQHIWEQIKYRIKHMNKECFNTGSCVECGCQTTQLQMANKRCDGICYPTMMNKEKWRRFKSGSTFPDIDGIWIKADITNLPATKVDKHIFYIETAIGYVPHKDI